MRCVPAGGPPLPRKHRWWMEGAHTKDHKPVAAAGDRELTFIQRRWEAQDVAVPSRSSRAFLFVRLLLDDWPCSDQSGPVRTGEERRVERRQCAAVSGTAAPASICSAAMGDRVSAHRRVQVQGARTTALPVHPPSNPFMFFITAEGSDRSQPTARVCRLVQLYFENRTEVEPGR